MMTSIAINSMAKNPLSVNKTTTRATLVNTIKYTRLLFTAIACGIFCLSNFTLADNTLPAANVRAENVAQLVKISRRMGFDNAKILDGIDLSKYTRVVIHPASVTFQKSWERNHRTDVSSRYKEMIKEDYAKLLTNELIKALTKEEKIIVVDANINDTNKDSTLNQNQHTLTIIPSITNLFINGPETITTSTSYVFEAGRATLQLQLIDSNQQTIALIEDSDDTAERSFLNRPERATRIRNYYDFRLLMRDWSNDLAKLLQDSTSQKELSASNT